MKALDKTSLMWLLISLPFKITESCSFPVLSSDPKQEWDDLKQGFGSQ